MKKVIYSNEAFTISRIGIGIPIKALKIVNLYLISTGNEKFLVDSGMGNVPGYEKIIEDVDAVFITHFHVDHFGGIVRVLDKYDVDVYMNKIDLNDVMALQEEPEKYLGMIKDLHISNGVPKELADKMLVKHPGFGILKRIMGLDRIVGVDDGYKIPINDDIIRVVWTPGHTPGHSCLYLENQRHLFSGDHILPDITPNIALLSWSHDPLKDYIDSLDKIYNLEIDLTFPGHREIIYDVKRRIEELKRHHNYRLNEMLHFLSKKSMTAYELASKLTWDVKYDTWEDFPVVQKYFAVAETLSHLKYLYSLGKVDRKLVSNVYVYHLTM